MKLIRGIQRPSGRTIEIDADSLGGSSSLLIARVELSAYEIAHLATQPRTLVSVAGSYDIVVPIFVVADYKFGTTPYSGSEDLKITTLSNWNNDFTDPGFSVTGVISGRTSDGFAAGRSMSNIPANEIVGGNREDFDGDALVIFQNGSELSGGDGVLTVTVGYFRYTPS